MRKLFATITTLAMTTQLARAADWPLCPSYEVKARTHSGVVLVGSSPLIMTNPMGPGSAPMNPGGGSVGGGAPSMGGGSFMGGMPPTGGGTFMGGMHPTGAEGANTGNGTDPPRAKTRNNPRNRKTSGVQ
jgi:hypothetical protein